MSGGAGETPLTEGMRRLTGSGIGAVLVLAAPVQAVAQMPAAWELDLTGRVQIQFNTSSVDGVPFSTFEMRRVRLGVELEFEEWLFGRIQPEYALGELRLADAFIDMEFHPALGLRLGQFKKPFSLLELTSSTVFPTIERGLRIRGIEDVFRVELGPGVAPILVDFGDDLVPGEEQALLDVLGYEGRDIGAALHGAVGRLGYEVGVFNGQGPDQQDENGRKSFAGRLTVQPWETFPLVLGAGVSYHELAFDGLLDGVAVVDRELSGTALEVDAEWGEFRRPGLRVLAEATTGDNLAVDEPFVAAQGIVAYFRPVDGERIEGIEPVGRVSFGDPSIDRDGDEGWLLTPGVNVYFFGRNRLMLNWDVFLPGAEQFEAANALRAQAQIYF